MQLPPPLPLYSMENEGQTRATLQREDLRNRKKGEDIDMATGRLILTSPDGTRFALTIDNAGILSTDELS